MGIKMKDSATKKVSMTMFNNEWLEIENSALNKSELLRTVIRPFLNNELLLLQDTIQIIENTPGINEGIKQELINNLKKQSTVYKNKTLNGGKDAFQIKMDI